MVFWPRPCTYRAFIRSVHLLDHDRAHSFGSHWSHFTSPTVNLFQGFALHLQLHLGVFLEDLRVSLAQQYMYHAIVKRIALQNFLRVNQKDYTPILKGCSPDIHHRFGGHHALGGERHDRDALRRWFERLGRLAPTLQLTVHDVWVKGGPWNTTVIMRWSAVQDLPDGSPYNNHGVHIIRMRWGKVFDIDANEDSQLVAVSLQIWAKYGVNEALADPILS
jgi:ketosteroid isomerase-like protein